MEKAYIYDTRFGKIVIMEDKAGITGITRIEAEREKLDTIKIRYGTTEYELQETDIIRETAKQLEEYFDKNRKVFTIPLNPKGTPFRREVWEALRTIPYGETRSYRQIAVMVGNPNASRAVGMANHNNPIMFIIPCHRVIGANGKLTGYAGGLEIKQQLLELEKERKE